MTDTVQFDESVYQILRDELGDEDAVEVLRTFLDDTAGKFQRIGAKLDDRAELRREAHSIKSSAATFGFAVLSRLARELEVGAPTMDGAELQDLVARMAQSFEHIKRFAETTLLDPGAAAA